MKKISLILTIIFLGQIFQSCHDDFDDMNVSPNNAEEVSPNYLLSYVISETTMRFYDLVNEHTDIAGAMQYTQRGTEFNAANQNCYQWGKGSWSGYYDILRTNQLMYEAGEEENNQFFMAASLIMKSFIFGLLADLYGDCPYSEALQANSSLLFPKYDAQKDVYEGVLTDLRTASEILEGLDSRLSVLASSDLLYGGERDKWIKFANSLRLRYCLRLDNKKGELGINTVNEFNDAASKVFESNDDNATLVLLGLSEDNSAAGGSVRSSNKPYAFKPGKPLVDYLKERNDPRLQRWINPVERKWDFTATEETTVNYIDIFGDSYEMTILPTNNTSLDTSVYVGLPIGYDNLEFLGNYNRGEGVRDYPDERSTYISYLSPIYFENSNDYVNPSLITYAEVEFILAEAAYLGDYGVSSVEEHYKAGIEASMDQYKILSEAQGFDFEEFYNQQTVSYNSSSITNKHELILTQKWIALWLQAEAWFDWRRTGYPDFEPAANPAYGPALPLRIAYPEPFADPQYVEKYEEAVANLVKTSYVPSNQSNDHSYSKMWLLQGTEKPY
ncbi:SusD/RagB family nutrient-binding outer membrane lipoprotein [Maribellus comscasis]|uniref:SusD/RagB family nutrient-binding outer membrane lipoprotein n=1 Tax=Maribellus comscasis TaxID=2681766 RepID=A0A6I6KA40_9BACT|nr:SusD/RagB family nutrient-binding outer membrane lipoprotein [Maribellus comscasis]QGY47014.1 SusD/RagB family nutrient-binding outer membrane lipoprotein [Maribellus comscasis]